MTDKQKSGSSADKPAEEKKEEQTPQVGDSSTEEKKPVQVPDKFKSIVEEIEKMSVLDLSELVKILEDKFGVSAVASMVPLSGTAPSAASAEEKSEFDIELTAAGENKISVIKVVREVTAKGLKEAKDMVEGAPVVLKNSLKKEEAEAIKKKLEEAGAQATLK